MIGDTFNPGDRIELTHECGLPTSACPYEWYRRQGKTHGTVLEPCVRPDGAPALIAHRINDESVSEPLYKVQIDGHDKVSIWAPSDMVLISPCNPAHERYRVALAEAVEVVKQLVADGRQDRATGLKFAVDLGTSAAFLFSTDDRACDNAVAVIQEAIAHAQREDDPPPMFEVIGRLNYNPVTDELERPGENT